jgi:hypothetical protein
MLPFSLRSDALSTLVCAFWMFGLVVWVVYGLFPDPTFLEVQRNARNTQEQLNALRKEVNLLHDALMMYKTRPHPHANAA